MISLGRNILLARFDAIFLIACQCSKVSQLSALREVSLAKEIHEAGAPGLESLYLGQCINT